MESDVPWRSVNTYTHRHICRHTQTYIHTYRHSQTNMIIISNRRHHAIITHSFDYQLLSEGHRVLTRICRSPILRSSGQGHRRKKVLTGGLKSNHDTNVIMAAQPAKYPFRALKQEEVGKMATPHGPHCPTIMKLPRSLPLQMAQLLLPAQPDSVANHVTDRSISDRRALT